MSSGGVIGGLFLLVSLLLVVSEWWRRNPKGRPGRLHADLGRAPKRVGR